MTAAPLVGPHIQAAGYTKLRQFREATGVKWLVAHSAEGAKDELALGAFFKAHASGSSNAGIGQDGGYATFVNYGDTCWAAPPLNQEAEHVELCGFAKWTRAEWLAVPKLLETFARWLAWRCTVRRIPIVLLTAAQLRAGASGIVDHDTVNEVFGLSDHWDVGEHFPWDVVIPRARQLAAVTPATAVTRPPATPSGVYVVKAGDTLGAIAKRYRTTVAYLAKANGLRDVNRLAVGQRLKVIAGVPAKAPAKPKPVPPRTFGILARGDHGPNVALVQRFLGIRADSDFGPRTEAAVEHYQATHHLTPDGVVGPRTWALIRRSLGI